MTGVRTEAMTIWTVLNLAAAPDFPQRTDFTSDAFEGVYQFLAACPRFVWIMGGVIGILFLCNCLLLLRVKQQKHLGKQSPRQRGNIGSIHVGKVHGQGSREYQQDSFGISDPQRLDSCGVLAVVADGMGGLKNGDEISSAAVETILDGFLYSQGQGTPEQVLLMLTQWSVREINAMLGPDHYRSGGSTLVAGLIKDGAFCWVSVGDSRICLCRCGTLIPLTREHDFKQKLALQAVNGEIPLQDVYTDKRKDGLVSFLGMGALEQIDFPSQPLPLFPGDRLILMTDGVYNALTDKEILEALEKGADDAAKALQAAIERKGYQDQDNYTAVILTCEAEPAASRKKEGRKKP